LEERLGERFPYFICGLLNRYGLKGTAKILGVHWRTLEFELMRLGIDRRWIVLDSSYLELYQLMESVEGEQGDS